MKPSIGLWGGAFIAAGLLIFGCGGSGGSGSTNSGGSSGGTTGGTQCSPDFLLPNYAQANDPSNGEPNLLLEWDGFPLNYFISNEDIRTFGSTTVSTTDTFQQSLNRWVVASNNQASYVQVSSDAAADITLTITQQANPPGPGDTLGRTSILYFPSTGIIVDANIEIFVWPQMSQAQFQNGLRGIMTHEAGHALFLSGHSPDQNDAMFPEGSTTFDKALSLQDKNTFITSYCGVFQSRSRTRSSPGEEPVLIVIETPRGFE